jgi:hypothetical protein
MLNYEDVDCLKTRNDKSLSIVKKTFVTLAIIFRFATEYLEEGFLLTLIINLSRFVTNQLRWHKSTGFSYQFNIKIDNLT